MQNPNIYSKIEDGLQDNQIESKCSVDADKSCAPKNDLEARMWPMMATIGTIEVLLGVVLLTLVLVYSHQYDKMYDSKVKSIMPFGGLAALAVSGIALLVSLVLDNRRVMWFYILSSISLCIFIFMLSLVKIHFALIIMQKDTFKQHAGSKHFLLSTACVVGILTLLASVIHFIGNIMVFTYYNLRFVHPILFNCGP